MPLFERIHGYDEEATEEFLMSLRPHSKTHATVSFRGLSLELTPKFISRITGLPLGLPWSKEEKTKIGKEELETEEEIKTEDDKEEPKREKKKTRAKRRKPRTGKKNA